MCVCVHVYMCVSTYREDGDSVEVACLRQLYRITTWRAARELDCIP